MDLPRRRRPDPPHRQYPQVRNPQLGLPGRRRTQLQQEPRRHAQFDYDHFGLQGATLANQKYIYNYCCTPAARAGLARSSPAWTATTTSGPSPSIPPTLSPPRARLAPMSSSAAATTTRSPTSPCPPPATSAILLRLHAHTQRTQVIDHYTSNAAGVNGGPRPHLQILQVLQPALLHRSPLRPDLQLAALRRHPAQRRHQLAQLHRLQLLPARTATAPPTSQSSSASASNSFLPIRPSPKPGPQPGFAAFRSPAIENSLIDASGKAGEHSVLRSSSGLPSRGNGHPQGRGFSHGPFASHVTNPEAALGPLTGRPSLNPHRIRLLVHLRPVGPLAATLEPPLQQTQQPRIPVPKHKQHQERHREVVLRRDRVLHRPRKISPDRQLDPRHNPQPLAIHLGLARLALLLHPVLRRARKRGLVSQQRLHHRLWYW